MRDYDQISRLAYVLRQKFEDKLHVIIEELTRAMRNDPTHWQVELRSVLATLNIDGITIKLDENDVKYVLEGE